MKNLLTALILSAVFNILSFSQWIQEPFPSSERLWEIRFPNPTTGWVLGAKKIYRTNDEGLNWIAQDTVLANGGSALCALNSSVAFYSDWAGRIRKTSDGGITWRTVDTTRFTFNEIEFPTPEIGYAAGGDYNSSPILCILRKTTDAGESWQTITTLDAGEDFEAVSFLDAQRGWILSYGGLVFRTSNGGISWSFQDSVGKYNGINYPMRDIVFTTPDSGWAVGGISGTSVISRTTSGGASWTKSSDVSNTIARIAMVNSQIGWIVGRVYRVPPQRTTNGGITWARQTMSPAVDFPDIRSICMVNENVGWIVNLAPSGGLVYKTSNGGVTSALDEQQQAQSFRLQQNYPNPFNPGTIIRFTLDQTDHVSLKIFDITGREIQTLIDKNLASGEHSINWKPENVSSGIYLYRLQTRDNTQTRKLILIR